MTTLAYTRVVGDLSNLPFENSELIDVAQIAVERLYRQGGPDIRKRLEVLISSASASEKGQNERTH
jgi:hypothetical protein